MPTCMHNQWLEITGRDRDWVLLDPDRLSSVVDLLPDPTRQTPILMFFLGKSRKASVLKSIFSSNNLRRRGDHEIAQLVLDNSMDDKDSPWLIADCTLNAFTANDRGGSPICHNNQRLLMNYGEAEASIDRQTVIAHIHTNLIAPLAHVVCLFAEDFGGNKACRDYLRRWLSSRDGASSLQQIAGPDLLLVLEHPSDIDMFVQLECETEFSYIFESLNIITVDVTASSSLTAQKIRRTLYEMTAVALNNRTESHPLLSASHMMRIFHQGIRSFAAAPSRGLDILSASDHPAATLSESLTKHLTAFVRHSQELACSRPMVVELVASALLKQGYPDSLHHFPPTLIYGRYFARVVSSLPWGLLGDSDFRHSIRRRFQEMFCLLGLQRSAVTIRANRMRKHWISLRRLYSTATCWQCMVRAPEHMLHDGHGLCDSCVLECRVADTCAFTHHLHRCPVCGYEQQATFYIKPWTVDPNVLAIDGGGIKGIVALVLLKRLTAALGSHVEDYFHYTAGTSAGGLIVLDHIVANSSIESSVERFKSLAQRIFPPRSYSSLPFVCKFLGWLKWLLSDNKHDSSVLEDVVQEVFGTRERLFGSRRRHERCRIGIMATTASTSQLRIFTNYNGEARAERDNAYSILRSDKPTEEPFLWEVARCTTAAPGFFRPKHLKSFGSLQDGAMRANNPSAVARLELGCIWPHASKPHVLVSIGTGFSSQDLVDMGAEQSILRDGFIARIFRSFMSSPSVDGDSAWLNLLDSLSAEERKQHFRLSLPLDGDLPALDDAFAMSHLEAQAITCHQDYSELVRCLWASRFFMEFQSEPQYCLGEYHCRAIIHFQGDDIREFLEVVCRNYRFPQIRLGNRVISRLYQQDDICQTCGCLQLPVHFAVHRLEECISLKLVYASGTVAPLNGDGQSAQWFLRRQMLHGALRRWPVGRRCCAERLATITGQISGCGKKRKAAEL